MCVEIMARPRIDSKDRRDAVLGIRLSVAERAELEAAAAAHDLTPAEFIRRRSLGYRLPQLAAEQKTLALVGTALIRLGVNLNQIAHHMNAGRSPPGYLPALIDRINKELDRLYGARADGGGPVL
jgi:hypothetical protein